MTAAQSPSKAQSGPLKNIIRQVTALIEAGVEHSARLLQLLETERSTLISRDSESLQALLAAKNNALQDIEKTQLELLEILQQSGYADSLSSAERLSLNRLLQIFLGAVSKAEADPRLPQDASQPSLERCSSQYRKLQQILEKCRNNNNINGITISNSQTRTKQALRILRGQNPNQTAEEQGLLYSADGVATAAGETHDVGSA